MAGLDPAIHALPLGTKNVDARDKPGHDAWIERGARPRNDAYHIFRPAEQRRLPHRRRRFYFSRSLPTLCTNGIQDASYQSFDKGENNA